MSYSIELTLEAEKDIQRLKKIRRQKSVTENQPIVERTS